MIDTSTHNDGYPATWAPGGPIERATNKCKAEIEFAVDYEIQVFECDLEEGHIGTHRQKGINDYNGGEGESYTIYWESKVDASVYKRAEELETPIQEELLEAPDDKD